MKNRILRALGPLVGLALFAAALYTLHGALRNYRYADVVLQLGEIPGRKLLLALGLTALSYFVLTGYDTMGLRYVGRPLRYGRTAAASFIGYAFSHSLGLSLLTGGSVRYRLYSAWGLSAGQVTGVVAFCGLSFWLGFLTLGGAVFLTAPPAAPGAFHLPVASLRALGGLFLAAAAAYLASGLLGLRRARVRGFEFRIPSGRLRVAQIAVSCADWLLASGVLYTLLPRASAPSYPAFLGIYLLAALVGVVSQVPGGLGVFDTALLLLASPEVPAANVVGSLVAFRLVYFLVPLVVALVLLGAYEALRAREGVKRVARLFGRGIPALAPNVLALTTFLGGAILLVSGATPSETRRLLVLREFLPLPVLEVSHFLGSVAGVGLLLLARGLQLRLDVAYHLTTLLLGAGVVFSLLKGFDYEEAIALTLMLAVLIPARQHFYRKASLITERFTPWWVAAIGVVFLGSMWLGFFSYKHVDISNELWWQFAFRADAPRFLRAAVGAIVAVSLFALARLLGPAPPEPARPDALALARAQSVVARSPATLANLALLGDKSLLFSDSGRAFIMYGVEGRSWVALGDPVGPDGEAAELVWRFRELCDRHGGWSVFYQVQPRTLHLYLDLGLSLLKLGEEARVRLDRFSLDGKSRKPLRNLVNRLEREGCGFEIVPPASVAARMDELRAVSDAWLLGKRTREKSFSLGAFVPDYLRRFPAALVVRGGRVVAFANVWLGAGKEELSPDLMRYRPDGPEGVIEYLFVELMRWGKADGYRTMNLGMAPLSGLESRALAPLWSRVGAVVFRHGEHFYNFQGLRRYKEKFDPEWEPRYLATPDGLALPRVLANLAALVSGGLRGIVAK